VPNRLRRDNPVENTNPYSLAWSPDGKRIAVGYIWDSDGGFISVFDSDTGINIHDIWVRGVPQSVAWTPDGRRIISVCNFNDAQFLKVYDAVSGRELY
jgi:DNA-binding beta-propeller fold protein YncE